jgi:lipid-A-disaccharide synthase
MIPLPFYRLSWYSPGSMRIFISAGEPSGDLHGASLVHELRSLRPDVECVGFGGEHMEQAGCRLLYPLCRLAVMWFLRVLLNIRVFFRLLAQADRFFADQRPDAIVLVDYPGFNWHVARKAHARGIPVFYFVPPQIWAWGGWRIRKMRRWIDFVLCNLPFEQKWYHDRGVSAVHIGHPYFDELHHQSLDRDFIQVQRGCGGPIVGILPGSRNQELDRNLSTLLNAAQRIHKERPDVRFLVACLRPEQRDRVQREARKLALPIEVHCGRTPEIIELSEACMAVSGSVSLELLYRQKPSVIVYRIHWIDRQVSRLFIRCRFITLVNLLAGKEVFPEYLTSRSEARAISGHIKNWLNNPAEKARVCAELAELCRRHAVGGASRRAAQFVVGHIEKKPIRAAA